MSFPALMEELAGEAGLGSKFLCVCEGFQALHRSQDKLLGLAPQCTRGSTQCFKHLKYTVSRIVSTHRVQAARAGREPGACLDWC